MSLLDLPLEVIIYQISPYLGIKQIQLRKVCKCLKNAIDKNLKKSSLYYLYNWYNKLNNISTKNFVENLQINTVTNKFIKFMTRKFDNKYSELLIRMANTTNVETIKLIWNNNIIKFEKYKKNPKYRKLFITLVRSLKSTFNMTSEFPYHMWKNFSHNKKYEKCIYNSDFLNILTIKEIEIFFIINTNDFTKYVTGILHKMYFRNSSHNYCEYLDIYYTNQKEICNLQSASLILK